MTGKPQALGALLAGDNSRLRSLAAEARSQFQLRDRVRRCLPPTFASQCSGAELEAGTVIIYMASAAGATLLRYHQQALCTRLAAEGLACERVRIQVLPNMAMPAAPPRPARAFAESVRQRLETTAASLKDGALRRSIQKLARGRRGPQ